MIYKPFKDISLSCLGMGNMRLPQNWELPEHPIDRDKGREIIDLAMKGGINYYDTAYVYGDSEEFLGDVMPAYKRDSYYLATKFNIGANPDYKAVFEEQLKRCKTDYFDFYLLHAVGDWSKDKYIESGCIEYFEEMRKQGKIRYFGYSAHASHETLKAFADYKDWDFTQIQLNYYDWLFGGAKGEYEILKERNVPVIVMEPVRGGRLASLTPEAEAILKEAHPDWSIASWAFRWVKRLSQVQVVLSGMSNLEQMKDNIGTFSDEAALTDEEEKLLFKACTMFKEQIQVPCTGCRYCVDNCPSQIDIPKMMEIGNNFRINGEWALHPLRDTDKPTPKDCIGCGACTTHCPQGIDIPGLMSEMSEKI